MASEEIDDADEEDDDDDDFTVNSCGVPSGLVGSSWIAASTFLVGVSGDQIRKGRNSLLKFFLCYVR